MHLLLHARIIGLPVPQGRPRAFKVPTGQIRMYDPKTSRTWKTDIKNQVLAMPDRKPPSSAPLAMRLRFFLPRPKTLPKRVHLHTKKPDCDNLGKAVKDSIGKGVTYYDDSQIVALVIVKEYSAEPGVEIEVWELPQAPARICAEQPTLFTDLLSLEA